MTVTYENGKIPDGILGRCLNFRPLYDDVTIDAGSDRLRTDANDQLRLLQFAYYRRFGSSLDVAEAYRGLTRQTAVWQKHINGDGPLAARVGTSNHGWAVAVDFRHPIDTYGTAGKEWLDEHAPTYGWHPAGNDFVRREAWHFEYRAGTASIVDIAGSGATPIEREEFTVAQYEEIKAKLDGIIGELSTLKAAVARIDGRTATQGEEQATVKQAVARTDVRTETTLKELATVKVALGGVADTTSDLAEKIKPAVGRIDTRTDLIAKKLGA